MSKKQQYFDWTCYILYIIYCYTCNILYIVYCYICKFTNIATTKSIQIKVIIYINCGEFDFILFYLQ